MALDPAKLKLNPHQSYTNGFFLLRVPLIINGQPAEIGYNDKRMLTLNCRHPSISITFDSIFNDVSVIMKKYGLSGITNYWCEDVPLFQLKFSSPGGMKRFIGAAEMVRNELASKISAQLAEQQRVVDPNATHSHLPVVVHTEVYLLIPDPVNKDADLRAMTAENLSACLSLWKESEVFDFGALFRANRTRCDKDCGPPTLRQLLAELYDIVEWYLLGVYLDIPETDLEVIKCDNDKVRDRRREMLSTWRQRCQPTWATIVTALTGIGRKSLAYKLALKYGIPTPSSMEAKPIPTLKKHGPAQQKICGQVEQMRSAIESKDVELMVRKQTSSEAQNARALAREKFQQIKRDAVQVQTRVPKLTSQRIEIRKQLEQKEHGLRKLQQIQEREKGELQSLIDEKNEEITRLQQELEAVQAELAFEKQKASSLQEQLQQATKDLEVKSARVQELKSASQEHKAFLYSQRKMVDQLLMQQAAALNSQQRYTEEIENQLSDAKQELESKTKEMEVLRQTIAHKEGKVKGVSTQLQTQEALLQMLPLQATKPDPCGELEVEEELQRLTEALKIAELRSMLVEAKDGKQAAQRQMETAQLESRLLQEFTIELGAARQRPPLKPKPPAVRQPPSVKPRTAVRQPPPVKPRTAVRQTPPVKPRTAVRQPPPVKPRTAVRQPPPVKPRTAVRQPQSSTQIPLQPGTPLKWEKCPDLPAGMRDAQAVVLGNCVYVGGGETLSLATDCRIYIYDFTKYDSSTWETLVSPTSKSALTIFKENLVLVGGYDSNTSTHTNQLWEFKQAWQPLPSMPTPRSQATAVSVQEVIVVAGGVGTGSGMCGLDCVEVYNGQLWMKTDPLPEHCHCIKSALHNDFLFLMGAKSFFQCSIQSLFKAAQLPSSSTNSSNEWTIIRDIPYEYSSVAIFGEVLVVVGGSDDVENPDGSLYMYDPLTQSWVHAGKMLVAVHSTCTVTLPSGEMMVIGGQTNKKYSSFKLSPLDRVSSLVYKASLEMC